MVVMPRIGSTDSAEVKAARKKEREKQRRSDLAGAFSELKSLVGSIRPGVMEQETKANKRGKIDVNEGDNEGLGMPRLQLISRTIQTLHEVHEENKQLRRTLDAKTSRSHGDVANHHPDNIATEHADHEKEVLVMVPTLQLVETKDNAASMTRNQASQPHSPSLVAPRPTYPNYSPGYHPHRHGPPSLPVRHPPQNEMPPQYHSYPAFPPNIHNQYPDHGASSDTHVRYSMPSSGANHAGSFYYNSEGPPLQGHPAAFNYGNQVVRNNEAVGPEKSGPFSPQLQVLAAAAASSSASSEKTPSPKEDI